MPFNKDKIAGLITTAIVHLAVLIVLLIAGIGKAIKDEKSFVLDFSALEEVERLQKELELKESIARKLESELGDYSLTASSVANVAVDRSQLKDDRGTNAEELYKEAERLQQELANGQGLQDEEVVDLSEVNPTKKEKTSEKNVYKGPSVVSYELEGRKASKLSIPAYRCMGAGRVTVLIVVSPQGEVLSAKIDENVSSTDSCLRSFAIRAARLSRFSVSDKAPSRQTGNIIYEFVAQ